MTEAPEPLTPPDCDLRGLEWMPLYGDRLFASDTWLMAGPEGRCAAMMLWWASWKQRPAGSLADQDRALAQLAGYGVAVKAWLPIKEEAMRGWVLCSDGRLYHPVVCELALLAWDRRVKERDRKSAYRSKRDGTATGQDAVVPRDRTRTGCGQDAPVPSVGDGDGHVERRGEEKRKKESPSVPLRGSESEVEFNGVFWPVYPRRVAKDAALKAFIKARKTAALAEIMAGLRRYVFREDPEFQPHAATWLNAGSWKIDPDVRPPTVVARETLFEPYDPRHPTPMSGGFG